MSTPSQVSGHTAPSHAGLGPRPLKLGHISDLHFGRAEPQVVEALTEHLNAFQPDLIVVTGDLTQRARRSEFHAASRFLDTLIAPTLIVPGNHDIAPFFRPLSRLLRPRAAYRRCIASQQQVTGQEFVALGLDTVSRWRVKEGSFSRRDLAQVERVLGSSPHGFKIVASHHPLIHPNRGVRTRHEARLLRSLDDWQVDLALSGHLHGSWSGSRSHRELPLSTLFVEASTATSNRLRGQPNAYNQLEVSALHIDVRVCSLQGARFDGSAPAQRYARAFAELRAAQAQPVEALS